METKKLIGAAAFSLALVGGGVAGALIGTPGTSGAQESTSTTTADPADGAREGRHADLIEAAAGALGITADELRTELEAGKTVADVAGEKGVDLQTVIDAVVAAGEDEHVERVTAFVNGELRDGRGPRGHHRGFHIGLETAAEALGMTTDELRTELEAGKTIADVAGEKGVDLQAVIDAVVAAGEDEHVERVTAFANGERPEAGVGRGGHRRAARIGLDAAATALGMTSDELREAMSADGATLASVAEAQGVDVQVVIDALVGEAQERLDRAVADGRLTQAEADEKATDLEARITEMVNSGRPDGPGPGFRGGPRP